MVVVSLTTRLMIALGISSARLSVIEELGPHVIREPQFTITYAPEK